MKFTETQVQSFIAKMNKEIIERARPIGEEFAEVNIGNKLHRLEVDAKTLEDYSAHLKLIITCWQFATSDTIKERRFNTAESDTAIAVSVFLDPFAIFVSGVIKTIDNIILTSEEND